MFVSFLYPYKIRNLEAPFLWVFYELLSRFQKDEIIFIGSEDYFRSPDYYIQKKRIRKPPCPAEVFDSAHKITVPHDIFADLEQEFHSPNEVWKFLITQRHEKLETVLDKIIVQLKNTYDVEAILTWCNLASLSHVAEKNNVKVIHNEWGPLRTPFYQKTAYFDFQGVNGKTESHQRYSKFADELKRGNDKATILSKKELLDLFLKEDFSHLASSNKKTRYQVGLPLQVEDDSNIVAFAKGLTNFELINIARGVFEPKDILIRRHPAGHLEYKNNLGVIDKSSNATEFIHKCERIATINSSIGLESVMLNKKTYILGENPFSFIAYNKFNLDNEKKAIPDELTALNFLLFGYIIPAAFLFNAQYYRWRLSGPSETEIYKKHQDFYIEAKSLEKQNHKKKFRNIFKHILR